MADPDLKDEGAAVGVRWADEEAAHPRSRRPDLQRRLSNSSMSIRSVRREVDPSLALPVQYRTLSIDIDESQRQREIEATKAKDATADEFKSMEWHSITADEAMRRLRTTARDGLSVDLVERNQKVFGKNAPSPPRSRVLQKTFSYLFTGFSPILLIGAVLVFISWKPLGSPPAVANLALACVLVGVWLIQVLQTVYQDWSSARVMSSITNMLPEDTLVIRDGSQRSLPASELVPGDIVMIKAGDKLPADLRFLHASSDARFDRSILTGESAPLAASIDMTDSNYLETRNIGLQGTHCVSGKVAGVVVSTGDRTVFGKIATLTNAPKTKMTTLEKDIMWFVAVICTLMITMVLIVIIVWATWLRKDHPDFIDVPLLIVNCVSVAIAFIPEGLPIAVTSGLTITAAIMTRNQICCKSLKTVETLGSVSVICSDKTGTLTENRMTVTECTLGTHTITADQAEEELAGSATPEMAGIVNTAVGQLRAVAALCNAAEFDAAAPRDQPIETWRAYGDATDQAILRFSERLGSTQHMRQCWQKTFELAFNSKNKYMIRTFTMFRKDLLSTTLPEREADTFLPGDTLLTIKGAPDVLINRCSHYTTNAGDSHVFDPEVRAQFEAMKNKYSAQGKRCILLARKTIPRVEVQSMIGTGAFELEMDEQAKHGLTLVGLVAIVDPLRPEIRDVVSTLRDAGIRFFMVTGDFSLTAQAIAEDAGILTSSGAAVHNVSHLPRDATRAADAEKRSTGGESSSSDDGGAAAAAAAGNRRTSSIVISGPELMTLTEHQWTALTQYEEIVFARTTPEQKLRIVREFQRDGGVVAMTGDGVNDAPSLKAADVGIAIGNGSDIAKEAADMVLLGTFSSVVEAVRYGRVVFDNLKKVICYLLPAGSFAEFWPVMTSVLFGLPQILSSFLMIIICCLTDCGAAMVLSYEQPEADVMLRRPRNVKRDRLVDWRLVTHAYGILGVLMTFSSFAMSYWYLDRNGVRFADLWFSFGEIPAGVAEDEYTHKLNVASNIYFVNLVVMQWFNVMAVRTRRRSVFQHPPLFNKDTQNWKLFPAIAFALVIALVFCYAPLEDQLGITAIPVEHWFLPMAFGVAILLMDEARKYVVRRSPGSAIGRMAW